VFVRDDQSTPDITATVARELIEVEGVDILVGTVSSGATATLQELARENQIPLIVAPAAANDITGVAFNEYTFRTSRNNYQDAVNLCEYLVNQYSTFVQIAPDYAFGYGGAAAFRDACTLFGGEFVADDIFAPADTTEFTPYMEQILDSGAEAFLVTWAGGGFVPMMQAATELGVFEEMSDGRPASWTTWSCPPSSPTPSATPAVSSITTPLPDNADQRLAGSGRQWPALGRAARPVRC
jgi:branched-chain amino acid transport system substrate-binding protein